VSWLRSLAAAVMVAEGLALRQGAGVFRTAVEGALGLRRLLLVSPAGAVEAQCRSPPPDRMLLACERRLEWRVGGAMTSVCDGSPPSSGDPRFATARYWRITLGCAWRGPVRADLPPLQMTMFR
jgi:hypothetical protein